MHEHLRVVCIASRIAVAVIDLDEITVALARSGPGHDTGRHREHVSAGVAGLRRYFTERGRDPAELRIRAVLPVRLGAAGPDLEATIATIPDFAAAGATTVVLPLAAFARTFEDVGLILRRFSEA